MIEPSTRMQRGAAAAEISREPVNLLLFEPEAHTVGVATSGEVA